MAAADGLGEYEGGCLMPIVYDGERRKPLAVSNTSYAPGPGVSFSASRGDAAGRREHESRADITSSRRGITSSAGRHCLNDRKPSAPR